MRLYRIMIVDDEAEIREGIVRLIEWEAIGFTVAAEVENGLDALEIAETIELDAVLTDIKMPFMDGLTLVNELRKRHPAIKPIILTGFDEFEYAQEAIRLNVVEYALKPVDVSGLTETLCSVKAALDEEIALRQDMVLLRKNYEKSLPLLRSKFLSDVVSGALSETEILQQQADNHVSFCQRNNVVAVFDIDRQKFTSALSAELLPLSLQQTVDQLFLNLCKSISLLTTTGVVVIASFENGNPIGKMMRIANEVCSICRRLYDISVTAGVGRSYDGLEDIHTSFSEARTALEYKASVGTGCAISIQDMEQNPPPRSVFGVRAEQHLLSALKFGGPEQIRSMVHMLCGRLSDPLLTGWERRSSMAGLVHVLMEITSQCGEAAQRAVDEKLAGMMPFSETAFDEDALYSICLRLRESLHESRASAASALVSRAQAIIAERYRQPDLSVDVISEELHISPSYFSTIFKQETGQNYIQHLTNVRMAHAAELLQTTQLKTSAIALECGYEEPNYFSYVFKKQFGVSPSKFRER